MPFTKKDKVRVMVYTLICRIEGDLHIIPESRLTDMLNVKTKDFLPMTDVKFYDLKEDKVFYETNYAAVNRDSVIAVFPLDGEERKNFI